MTDLCLPALVYLILSIVSIVIYVIQSLMGDEPNSTANFTSTNIIAVLIVKLIIMIAWTFLLNALCASGHTTLSWIILFLPIIIFLILVLFLFTNKSVHSLKQ